MHDARGGVMRCEVVVCGAVDLTSLEVSLTAPEFSFCVACRLRVVVVVCSQEDRGGCDRNRHASCKERTRTVAKRSKTRYGGGAAAVMWAAAPARRATWPGYDGSHDNCRTECREIERIDARA